MEIGIARTLLAHAGEGTSYFVYSGRFLDEHTSRLVELVQWLHLPDGDPPVSKGRLGYLMVEAYQNIVRHRAQGFAGSDWGDGRCLFSLHARPEGQLLCTRNPVTTEQTGPLRQTLENLSGKDAAGLKQLYMESIQRPQDPGQRGAGLGLIEMARRSGHPPQWDFMQLDKDHDLFSFALRTGQTPIEGSETLHALVLDQRIHLLHAGPWSPGLGKTLIGMAQVEIPPRAGRSSDRESVWGLVSSVVLPLLMEHSVLFALHGETYPMISVGGILPSREAGGFHAAMQGTDVEFSFGDAPDEGHVLALVHIPW